MEVPQGKISVLGYVISGEREDENTVITSFIDLKTNWSKLPLLNTDKVAELQTSLKEPATKTKINGQIQNVNKVESIQRTTRPVEAFLEHVPLNWIDGEKEIILTNLKSIQKLLISSRSGEPCELQIYSKQIEKLNRNALIVGLPKNSDSDTAPAGSGSKFVKYLLTDNDSATTRVTFSIMRLETINAIFIYSAQVNAIISEEGRSLPVNVEIKTVAAPSSYNLNRASNTTEEYRKWRHQQMRSLPVYIQGELGRVAGYVFGIYNDNGDSLETVNVVRYKTLTKMSGYPPGSYITYYDYHNQIMDFSTILF